MIDLNRDYISVIYKHPNSGYYLLDESVPTAKNHILLQDEFCNDCKMSRLTMSCYAATRYQYPESETKVARKEKKPKKEQRSGSKYGEMETTVSLDKYNGKLMNSIWGLYNRNSPHNFKSLQNAEEIVMIKEQGMMTENNGNKTGSSTFVQFSVPQFSGMIAVETTFEVNKPKTSLEKLENLFTSPIF